MAPLKISEHIVKLRHKKGITQEELASFLGVTKASVSKWETRQSYPDILLLPQIAAFFDISIDQLMGYEPQMSPEQIRKCYHDLASDFASQPFDDVMEKSQALVKEYYSCYPLLLQIALLWINHAMLAQDTDKIMGILQETAAICRRISEESPDMGIRGDAVVMEAMANLQLGKSREVIETLEPLCDVTRLRGEEILMQAYQRAGDMEQADRYSQILTYSDLGGLLTHSLGMMLFNMEDTQFCEETIGRIIKVIEAYDLEHLDPNRVLQFRYQCAVFYCVNGEKEKAIEELSAFVDGTLSFLSGDLLLHGDSYFSKLDVWFEELTLGTEAPRNKKVILDGVIQSLENPAFTLVKDDDRFRSMKRQVERKEV